MVAFRSISTFKGSQSSDRCQESTNRHTAVDTSSVILLCRDYYAFTMNSYCKQHNQVVKILNFLHICTKWENEANALMVNKYVGCWQITTTTLSMDSGLQQAVKLLMNRFVRQVEERLMVVAVWLTAKVLLGRLHRQSIIKQRTRSITVPIIMVDCELWSILCDIVLHF